MSASGIGDAMTTWIEERLIIKNHGKTMSGVYPTLATESSAEKSQPTLFENGVKVMAAVEAKIVTLVL